MEKLLRANGGGVCQGLSTSATFCTASDAVLTASCLLYLLILNEVFLSPCLEGTWFLGVWG